jgi:hypothetical protein
MAIHSVNDLIETLRRHELLQPEQLHDVGASFSDPEALVGELVRREWLTTYTADMLLDRIKQPTHTELIDQLTGGEYNQTVKANTPWYGGSIARQLGIFVIVSLLIGLALKMILDVPVGWALFWGFVLYRVAWNPWDLIDRSCAGCGCAFFSVTTATAFFLNWGAGQDLLQALSWGILPGIIVVLVAYAPRAFASTRADNRLHERLLKIPALTTEEARKQADKIFAHARMCRFTETPPVEYGMIAKLGPLLKELFTRFDRVKFLHAEGYSPDEVRFSRDALKPSRFLVGYVQLNYYQWVSCETAVKPHEDTIYVIDGRKHAGCGFVMREREVPEIT